MARSTKPDALELAQGHTRLEQAVLRSRQLLRKRAMVAGVAGAVPLPGLLFSSGCCLPDRFRCFAPLCLWASR